MSHPLSGPSFWRLTWCSQWWKPTKHRTRRMVHLQHHEGTLNHPPLAADRQWSTLPPLHHRSPGHWPVAFGFLYPSALARSGSNRPPSHHERCMTIAPNRASTARHYAASRPHAARLLCEAPVFTQEAPRKSSGPVHHELYRPKPRPAHSA
jgi:hypothetical protein